MIFLFEVQTFATCLSEWLFSRLSTACGNDIIEYGTTNNILLWYVA